MGFGPTPATQKVLAQTGLTLDHMDVIELNEAFAAQGLAVLRALGLKDDDARVNAWGGAIALGHPLGASGARLVTTAVNRLHEHAGQYALCTYVHWRGPGHCLDHRAGVSVADTRTPSPSLPAPATALAVRLPKPCWPRAGPWSTSITCCPPGATRCSPRTRAT